MGSRPPRRTAMRGRFVRARADLAAAEEELHEAVRAARDAGGSGRDSVSASGGVAQRVLGELVEVGGQMTCAGARQDLEPDLEVHQQVGQHS